MEIEQKFLINEYPKNLEAYECKDMIQGYLLTSPVLRIRKSNDYYIFTFKTKKGNSYDDITNACICEEVESELTKEAFEHLLTKCDGAIIKKKRYVIPLDEQIVGIAGLKAELDIFEGDFEGLAFAEVEFNDITDFERFNKPDWLGENVSDDIRYKNNYLSTITSREQFLGLFNSNGGR